MMFIRSFIFIGAVAIPMCFASAQPKSTLKQSKCVQIFYDQSPNTSYWMGKTYSIFLQNLLAHFPTYQQVVGPIEEYQKGYLNRCKANFYIGSYFENNIPKSFFEDFESTKSHVVWMGYSIWQPGADYFERLFGYTYNGLTKLNTELKDEKGRPTFFKFATYKGEKFRKYGEFSVTDPNMFMAPFENIIIKKKDNNVQSEVISELIHNGTNEKIPYIIRNKNKFYIADIPFSFMHEADRFLIVADLLFDVLDEKPMHNEKIAFLRIEDVFPLISQPYTFDVLNVLREMNVKASISLVPIYNDPLHEYLADNYYLPMESSPSFLGLLEHMKIDGHGFIWHGVTHQYEDKRNPYDALSTDDFEFWDAVFNKPVDKDSPDWVLRRLEDGIYSITKGNIQVQAWLTPHYQASALDYLIFARVFEWNVGRTIYFDYRAQNLPNKSADVLISSPTSSLEKRLKAFEYLQVQTFGPWNGQMFPYLIFGDIYGQRLIPENLGNSQPFLSKFVVSARSIDDMLEDARRNLVLRDTWASLFYHPALLDILENGGRGQYPGDPTDLRKLIGGIKDMGYRFITVDEVSKRWTLPKRNETLSLKELK